METPIFQSVIRHLPVFGCAAIGLLGCGVVWYIPVNQNGTLLSHKQWFLFHFSSPFAVFCWKTRQITGEIEDNINEINHFIVCRRKWTGRDECTKRILADGVQECRGNVQWSVIPKRLVNHGRST